MHLATIFLDNQRLPYAISIFKLNQNTPILAEKSFQRCVFYGLRWWRSGLLSAQKLPSRTINPQVTRNIDLWCFRRSEILREIRTVAHLSLGHAEDSRYRNISLQCDIPGPVTICRSIWQFNQTCKWYSRRHDSTKNTRCLSQRSELMRTVGQRHLDKVVDAWA